jgi:hypothetical protein
MPRAFQEFFLSTLGLRPRLVRSERPFPYLEPIRKPLAVLALPTVVPEKTAANAQRLIPSSAVQLGITRRSNSLGHRPPPHFWLKAIFKNQRQEPERAPSAMRISGQIG